VDTFPGYFLEKENNFRVIRQGKGGRPRARPSTRKEGLFFYHLSAWRDSVWRVSPLEEPRKDCLGLEAISLEILSLEGNKELMLYKSLLCKVLKSFFFGDGS
jgi:hypothetical protein